LLALLFVARATQAQTIQTNVDAGVMGLRYADTVSTGAAVVTPHAYAEWRSGFADASATMSQFTAGGWSAQGILSGSRFIPTNRSFVAELAALAGGSTHNDGTRTGEIVGNGRLHFSRGTGELFVGAGAGRTWDGTSWRSLLLGEAGISVGSDLGNATLSLSPASVDDSINYADLQGSVEWQTRGVALNAVVGSRFGDQLTSLSRDAKSWVSLSAARPITDRLVLLLSGGTYPIDPTQGFPGGRFVSLALRVMTSRRSPVPQTPQPTDSPVASPVPVVAGFDAHRDRAGSLTLTVTAPGANLVEVNGDFTNWVPLSLTRSSSDATHWSARLPIEPGTYQMNIRINGGKWIVPPGMLSLLDEFGGAVGLLVIE
jgi:hypothetical protein